MLDRSRTEPREAYEKFFYRFIGRIYQTNFTSSSIISIFILIVIDKLPKSWIEFPKFNSLIPD